jgi:hypothetical protein
MAAGVATKLSEISDILTLVDTVKAAIPAKARGPYQLRQRRAA